MPNSRSRSWTTAYAPEPAWVSAYQPGGSRSSTSASAACFQTSEIFPKCRLAMIHLLPGRLTIRDLLRDRRRERLPRCGLAHPSPAKAFMGFVLGQPGNWLSGGLLLLGVEGPRPDACGPAAP